jgi:hypothetical protein
MRSPSAPLAGARSACSARPATGGGVNKKGEGNHGAGTEGPRRVPGRRPRVRHRSEESVSAVQNAASLAPTPSAALTMEALRQRTHRDLSENGGSEHPERLRSELLLKLLCSLPHAGAWHQAARSLGMGSCIDEPDPCPSRIKTGRVVLDANRADRGRGGDGRIGRGQTNQAPAGSTQGRLCQQAHHHTNNPMGTPMHPQEGASERQQPSRRVPPPQPPSRLARARTGPPAPHGPP